MPREDLYDALTGLPNRTLTLDRAERMVARAGRDSGMLAGALFVDIDRLKDVNEKLGQAAGDQLLRIVGERLEVVVRARTTPSVVSEETSSWSWSNRRLAGCDWTRWPNA